jgi:regulator of cell morphogenesis and NO signaling
MRSGENNNLELMKRFFDELKGDIVSRITHDSQQWFPKISALGNGAKTLAITIDDSSSILDKLNDLKNMFILHLTGNYDLNLCYGVINAIILLEKDIRQNDRIRNRILLPLFQSLQHLDQ